MELKLVYPVDMGLAKLVDRMHSLLWFEFESSFLYFFLFSISDSLNYRGGEFSVV